MYMYMLDPLPSTEGSESSVQEAYIDTTDINDSNCTGELVSSCDSVHFLLFNFHRH